MTVTVIDGATNHTLTLDVGLYPVSVAVNPVTNKIYVVNLNDPSLQVLDGTVAVIDGTTSPPPTFALGLTTGLTPTPWRLTQRPTGFTLPAFPTTRSR